MIITNNSSDKALPSRPPGENAEEPPPAYELVASSSSSSAAQTPGPSLHVLDAESNTSLSAGVPMRMPGIPQSPEPLVLEPPQQPRIRAVSEAPPPKRLSPPPPQHPKTLPPATDLIVSSNIVKPKKSWYTSKAKFNKQQAHAEIQATLTTLIKSNAVASGTDGTFDEDVLGKRTREAIGRCRVLAQEHGLVLTEELQEKFVEEHTPLYWSIIRAPRSRSPVVYQLLKASAPLTRETLSDVYSALLVAGSQGLFQELRMSKEISDVAQSGKTKLLMEGGAPKDYVDVLYPSEASEIAAMDYAFQVNLILPNFQRRLLVSEEVVVEFIARARMWRLEFCSNSSSKKSHSIKLSLMEHSTPTYIDSLFEILPPPGNPSKCPHTQPQHSPKHHNTHPPTSHQPQHQLQPSHPAHVSSPSLVPAHMQQSSPPPPLPHRRRGSMDKSDLIDRFTQFGTGTGGNAPSPAPAYPVQRTPSPMPPHHSPSPSPLPQSQSPAPHAPHAPHSSHSHSCSDQKPKSTSLSTLGLSNTGVGKELTSSLSSLSKSLGKMERSVNANINAQVANWERMQNKVAREIGMGDGREVNRYFTREAYLPVRYGAGGKEKERKNSKSEDPADKGNTLRISSSKELTPARYDPKKDEYKGGNDVTVDLGGCEVGKGLLVGNTPWLGRDGTLWARWEARLVKPEEGEGCVVM